MNFQTLTNAKEKQYIQLAAVVVTAFGPPTPRNWPSGDVSYETECTCTDGTGQVQTLIATSKFADPVFDQNDIGRPMDWKMKWFNSKNGAKISGYPLKPKQQGGQRQQPAQQPQSFQQAPAQQPQQQAPQNRPNFNPSRQPQAPAAAAGAVPFTPPQQTYTPVGPSETTKSIVWQGALKAAIEIVGGYEEAGLSMDEYMAHLQRWWAKLYPILLEPGSLDEDGSVPGFIARSPVTGPEQEVAQDEYDAQGNLIPF